MSTSEEQQEQQQKKPKKLIAYSGLRSNDTIFKSVFKLLKYVNS